jgi:hypothetical protein
MSICKAGAGTRLKHLRRVDAHHWMWARDTYMSANIRRRIGETWLTELTNQPDKSHACSTEISSAPTTRASSKLFAIPTGKAQADIFQNSETKAHTGTASDNEYSRVLVPSGTRRATERAVDKHPEQCAIFRHLNIARRLFAGSVGLELSRERDNRIPEILSPAGFRANEEANDTTAIPGSFLIANGRAGERVRGQL